VALTGISTAVAVKVTNGPTSSTYTVNILRKQTVAAGSHDSTLASLSVAGHSLSPAFSTSVQTYTTDSLASGSASALVTATATASAASLTCNGGKCTDSVPLTGTSTAIAVKVTNGSSSLTYTVYVLRKQVATATSHDTTLSALGVAGRTLTPTFSAGVLTYTTDSLASGSASALVTATATASASTVTCNGGKCTDSVALTGASTAVAVKVTNGTSTLTYTVYVLRKQVATATSHDTTLSALGVAGHTLTPTFSAGVLTYTTDSLTSGTASALVNATATASAASVTCNGGKCTDSIALTGASTAVAVKVTNGTSTLTYTVDILRKQVATAASHDTTLSALGVAGHTLTPTFSASVLTYTTDSLTSGTASALVNATATASAASVTCNGGKCTDSIALTGASTAVAVKVTNGTSTLTYTVDILRKQVATAAAHDTTLASLLISGHTLSPTFSPSVLTYSTDSVASNYLSVTVSAAASATAASVTCNGSDCSNAITLTGANTPVAVKVTNGSSSLTYTLNILRKQVATAVAHDTTISWIGASNMTPASVTSGVTTYAFTSASGSGFNMTLTDTNANVSCDLTGASCSKTRVDLPTLTANKTLHLTVTNGSSSLVYTFNLYVGSSAVAHDTTISWIGASNMTPASVTSGVTTYAITSASGSGFNMTLSDVNAKVACDLSGASCSGTRVDFPTLSANTTMHLTVTNGSSSLVYTFNLYVGSSAVAHDTTISWIGASNMTPTSVASGVTTYTFTSASGSGFNMTLTDANAKVSCDLSGASCSGTRVDFPTLSATTTMHLTVTNGSSSLVYTFILYPGSLPVAHDTTISWIGASNMTPTSVTSGVTTYTFSSASGSGFNMTLTDTNASVSCDLSGATCSKTRVDLPTLLANTTMHMTVTNGSSSLVYTFILNK
jgi:hypothetical protein